MTRIIKLQPEFVKGKYQDNYHQVPKLTLKGNWLADAGFQPHQTVHVTVENGRMIIIATVPEPLPEQVGEREAVEPAVEGRGVSREGRAR